MKPGFASAVIAILLVMMTACAKTDTAGREPSVSVDPVLKERAAKDAAFKAEDSPILPEDRSGFKGLDYYPLDPGLRFTVRLQRYSSPEQVRLGTNTGEIRSGLRYGFFSFQIGNQECRLQAYRLDDAPEGGPYLFIPFRDSTSGRETYGSGRYIDLKENTSGIYDLDFNRASNPYCAYNPTFSCPIPPDENSLKVAIRAGEKKYRSSRGH
jgi:uncharacterized protein (DUF1684 family)